tara:strand:- start:2029 stop:3564 length:1536 start_codon:yes stop_codon:yes gene_type:complete
MNLNVPGKKITLEREIEFEEVLHIIFKNKRIIFLIAIISSLITFIFSSYQEVIYRGKFKIIVDSSQNKVSSSSVFNELLGSGGSILGLSNNSRDGQNIETKIQILKGPVVLDSVYKQVKQKKEVNGYVLSFNEWIKNLEIERVPDTTILEVKYKDNDKELIIDVLERISLTYQTYSMEKVTKENKTSYDFLSSQYLIAKNEAKESSEKLNNFAIKNGLGNFDGIPLRSSEAKLSNSNSPEFKSSTPFDSNNRYYSLFMALQELETEYTRLSSILKEESSLLQSLKSQIEKFKTSLERPNEILIEFNDLVRESINDVKVVQSLDGQLRSIQLELVKQQDPWEILTKPRLEGKSLTWSNKKSSAVGFIFGSSIGILFLIVKSLSSGIIYTKTAFQRLLSYEYLFSLNFESSINNPESNKPALDLIAKKQKEHKVGFFILTNKFNAKTDLFLGNMKNHLNKKDFHYSENILELSDCQKIFLVAFRDLISQDELDSKIELLKFQSFDIEGWIFVE